ncbi:MAG: HlyD family secretion protein [Hyphomicrobiales bacterium]|nr:HlyD family secretion protein [Hyphomicrobiales bacterium]
MADISIEHIPGRVRGGAFGKQALRRALLALLASVFAAAGARFGYDWWTVGRFVETTNDAYVGGDVTPISPHVAGFVAEILIKDNEYVRAGQPLVRLDDRDFHAALDHADAVIAQRQATLASLEARARSQESVIEQARADVDAKAAQATFAEEDDSRYRRLADTGYGSRQNAERALALSNAARSALAASRAGVGAALQTLAVTSADIVEASAAVAQAEADLLSARLNLGYTDIRSPIDGYVANRAAQVGAYVSSGTYLLTVIPAHDLWVDANFKEDQLERMAPGQAVTVVADTLPNHVFHGRVGSLAHGAGSVFSVIPPENATGNFTKIVQRVPVRIALDPDDSMLQWLRPGLSTTVRVDTRSGSERPQ